MCNISNSFYNMLAFSQRLLTSKAETVSGSAIEIEVDEKLLNTLDTISQNLIWCKALLYLIVLAIVVFAVYGFFYFILSRFCYDNSVSINTGTIDTYVSDGNVDARIIDK